MLTHDHKPWEHQPGTFPRDHKPWGSVEPIHDCLPSVGSIWTSLQGRLPRAWGEASPGCMLVPTGGRSHRRRDREGEPGQAWLHPGPARPNGGGDTTQLDTSCTGHQLYRQWSPTPQTDTQGVMPRSLTPSIFQFPCRFYCSEKEKKRIKLITYG